MSRTRARAVEGRRFAKYGIGPSLVALPFYGASHRLFDRFELPETADSFGNLRTGPTIFGTGLANAVIGGATVAVTFLLAVELGFPLLVALATAVCLGADDAAGALRQHLSVRAPVGALPRGRRARTPQGEEAKAR